MVAGLFVRFITDAIKSNIFYANKIYTFKKCIAVKNAPLFSAIIILFTACSVAGTRNHPNLTPGINHVFLSVSNMDASIAFCTKAFDLKVVKSITKLITEQHDAAFKRTVKISLCYSVFYPH
jgi:Glyoxalase/Bleomycin resistance protein/Dioxygenase superfamily